MTATPLADMTALVTGGGSGIGMACAAALLSDGASVMLMGRTESRLADARSALESLAPPGASVATFAGDVTSEEHIVAAVDAAAALSPDHRLDLAVAAAGDGTLAPVIATELAEWERILAVSLTGVFLTIKHAGAAMVRAGGGSIVAISSVASHTTHRYMAPYSVAKAGVDMLVKTAADELGPAGVRVNAVNPGIISTDLVAMITPDDPIGQSYLTNMPAGRFGDVADVAPAVRFLCGPESGFITGACIPIDGGHHLRRGPDYSEWAAPMYPGLTFDS